MGRCKTIFSCLYEPEKKLEADSGCKLYGDKGGLKSYHYGEMLKRLNEMDGKLGKTDADKEFIGVGHLLRILWRKYEKELAVHTRSLYGGMHEQDIKGKYPSGGEQFGHDVGYWLGPGASDYDGFLKRLSVEAFAHMASSAVVNPPAFKVLKDYLPNAYEMFLGILDIIALGLEKHECEVESKDTKKDLPKAQDITERFISILKKSLEDVKEFKTPMDLSSIIITDGILYTELTKKLEKLSKEEIKEILISENEKELKATPFKFANFHDMVRTNGPWDLKNTEFANSTDQYNKVIISGKHYNVDVTGNVLYGFAGAAAGFSEDTLLKMAGLAQKNSDKSNKKLNYKPEYTKDSYWDDPRDQQQIKAGVYLYAKTSKSKIEFKLWLNDAFSYFNTKSDW